jgi:hypothetical protein
MLQAARKAVLRVRHPVRQNILYGFWLGIGVHFAPDRQRVAIYVPTLPLAKVTDTPKNDFHGAHLQVPFTNATPRSEQAVYKLPKNI